MLMALNNDTVVSKGHLTGLGGEFQSPTVFFCASMTIPSWLHMYKIVENTKN